MNGYNIYFLDFCFFAASFFEKKTCHKISVIHVTQPKFCPIQIVVSDIVDQSVTNLQLNTYFI